MLVCEYVVRESQGQWSSIDVVKILIFSHEAQYGQQVSLVYPLLQSKYTSEIVMKQVLG